MLADLEWNAKRCHKLSRCRQCLLHCPTHTLAQCKCRQSVQAQLLCNQTAHFLFTFSSWQH